MPGLCREIFLACSIFLAGVTTARSQPLSINTLAGHVVPGSAEGVGSSAGFNHPNGVAADSAGNVYVADTENSAIRKITPNEVVSTFAGFAGNFGSVNGSGTNAQFFGPQGIAISSGGNIYVADTANQMIRKITPAGVVSAFAGSAGYANSFDGAGTNAQFFQPEGIAVDSAGNVFVADTWNHTIRKITSAGAVSTWAGLAGNFGSADGTNSKARFNWPTGIAVDSASNLFVTDFLNHTIRKITPGGAVSTIAGLAGVWGSEDGTNSEARFFQPQGIVADSAGNLFVVDSGNQTIRKIFANGTNWIVTTVAGFPGNAGYADGVGEATQFYFPAGIAKDGAGHLYVADFGNNTIRTDRAVPPTITRQPLGQTLVEGENGTFTVAASSSSPITYQWQFNQTEIPGATDSSFTSSNVTVANAGQYSVVLGNQIGSVTSAPAVLVVNYFLRSTANPSNGGTILVSPQQVGYAFGDTVSLTATASPGFSFVGWSGDVVTASNQIVVTVTKSKTFVANFFSTADIILDNPDALYSGVWTIATSAPDKYGSYYEYAATVSGSSGMADAIYTPNIFLAGNYDVSIWYPQGTNRSVRAPLLIAFNGASVVTNVDQTIGGGSWRLIASRKEFVPGTNGFVEIKNNTGEINRIVLADAVRFTYNSGPIIYSQPQNQKARLHSSATFNVLAAATGQLTYQWQFNEGNIPGATNSFYTRTNIQPSDAGGYTVVLSNHVGIVISDIAALTLLPTTRLTSFSFLPDGRFHFTMNGESDLNYAIEASTNLINWDVVTNLSSPDGTLEFIDSAPRLEKRFYRARGSP